MQLFAFNYITFAPYSNCKAGGHSKSQAAAAISITQMKKFKIKMTDQDKWMVSHNEHPKFTCLFQTNRFNYERTITGLTDPTGDSNEIELLGKMEKWLRQHHKEKING